MRSYLGLFSAALILALSSANPVAAGFISSSITSEFNGTSIPGNDFIWFNSVIHLSGSLPATPFTISVRDASISFSAGGTNYTLSVPDATITFDSSAKATTTFSNGGFVTETNPSFSGNTFLAGLAFEVPSKGFPGGIKPVTWTADFSASKPGVDLNWQWAAAVYTSFGTDYNTLGIKPTDDPKADTYMNSDHAGTPEAYLSFVLGGARGGGGSNYTGSYSGTADGNLPVGPGPEVSSAPEPPAGILVGLGLIGSTLLLARRRHGLVSEVTSPSPCR
jgi:hypothetical protein